MEPTQIQNSNVITARPTDLAVGNITDFSKDYVLTENGGILYQIEEANRLYR